MNNEPEVHESRPEKGPPEWEWTQKGIGLNDSGRYEDATRCFEKALEFDPACTQAWFNKGGSLASLGRHEEALHCFDRSVELDPQHARAWSNKGTNLCSLGRYEDAIPCFDKALELDPLDVRGWNNKGSSLNTLGRHVEAIPCFDKALELDPKHAASWYNKGLAEERLGRRLDATRSYRQFISLSPAELKEQVVDAESRVRRLEAPASQPDQPKRKKWGWLRHLLSDEMRAAIKLDSMSARLKRYPELDGTGLCYMCKHYLGASHQGNKWVLTCHAFPRGIPDDIKNKGFRHSRIHPAQTDETLYEELDYTEIPARFEKTNKDMMDGMTAE
jgi:tetratricopeptide (TPR) repeat protein